MATMTFYPNAHPESTSVDGHAYQLYTSGAGQAWSVLRAAAGNTANDSMTYGGIAITSDTVSSKWRGLYRAILLFDTSALPDTATITSAYVRVYGYMKFDTLGIVPDIMLSGSNPASNTALVAGDYDSVGFIAGTIIPYSSFNASGWNTFHLNTPAFTVSKTGITKLGFINRNYDWDNVAPTWSYAQSSAIYFYYADQGTYKPELVVTYTTSTAYSQSFSTAVGLVPSIEQSVVKTGVHTRDVSANIGLVPTVTAAATYARSHTVAIGLVPSITSTVDANTYLCIASRDSGSIKTSSPTGTGWSTCAKSLAGDEGSSFLAVFQNRLCTVKQTGTGFIYSADADITTNWTKQKNFPATHETVTDLIVTRDANDDPQLAVITQKGMYILDVFDNFYLYPSDLNWSHNKDSGKCAILGKNGLYVAVGRSVLQQSGKTITLFGPDLDDGMVDEQQGIVTDIINVGYWIVIAVDGGELNKSGIYKRYLTHSHWHPVYVTSAINSSIKALYWENGTLYFGEGTNVKSLPLSGDTDNVKHDATYTYATTGDLVTSWIYGEHETMTKVAHKLWITSEGCTETEYITAYYQRNESTQWIELGSFNTSPLPTALGFGSNAAGIEFYRLRLKFTFTRGSTTTTSPKMTGWTLEYRSCPPVLWRWRFKVLARDTTLFHGETLLTKLKQAQATNTLMTFYPDGSKDGDSYQVCVSNMPGQEKISERGSEGEYIVQVDQVV